MTRLNGNNVYHSWVFSSWIDFAKLNFNEGCNACTITLSMNEFIWEGLWFTNIAFSAASALYHSRLKVWGIHFTLLGKPQFKMKGF